MKKGLTIATTVITLFTQLPLSSVFAQGVNRTSETTTAKAAPSTSSSSTTAKSKTGMTRAGDVNTDITIEAQKDTIEAGQWADFNLYFKMSGRDTSFTNVDLKVTLPDNLDENVTFTQDLAELKIAGVTPTYDKDKGILNYHFDKLDARTANKAILKIQTTNGAILPNTTLNVAAAFTGTDQNGESKSYDSKSAVKITADNNYAATNKLIGIEGQTYNNPNRGDIVNYGVGISAPKKASGALYVKEGSTVKATYTLGAGLDYYGVKDGAQEPKVSADGRTLTWEYTAPSYAEQKAAATNFFEKNVTIQAKVSDTAAYYSQITNTMSSTATFLDGSTNDTTPIKSVVMVMPNDPTEVPIPIPGGSAFPTNHLGPSNGNGGVASTSNIDPDITVNDDAFLSYGLTLSSQTATSTYIGFAYYNIYYNMDAHLDLDSFTTGNFYYMPNNKLPTYGAPKEKVSFAMLVKYETNGKVDADWSLLKMDMQTNAKYSRSQLGIPDGKKVANIWLWFHDKSYTKVPANRDAAAERSEGPDGKPIKMAPAGLYNNGMRVNATIDKGYTGQVKNTMDMTFYGAQSADETGFEAARYVDYTTNTWAEEFSGDVGQVYTDRIGPRRVEVAAKTTGETKVVKASVSLLDTVGSTVNEGENTVLTSIENNKASISPLNGPYTSYVLLPTGVTFKEAVSSTKYSAELYDKDYQGTGRQMVKVTMEDGKLVSGSYLTGQFKVDISKDATPNMTFNMIGTIGDTDYTAVKPTGDTVLLTDTVKSEDTDDIDKDGKTDTPIVKTGNAYVLNKASNLDISTSIKGDKDTGYGDLGNVTVGKKATYKATLKNDTDDKITSMQFLDVLPSIGDANITDGAARNSAYEMKLDGEITLPSEWENKMTVLYSTSKNPKRAGILDKNTVYPAGAAKIVDPAGAEDATWVAADKVSDWSTIHSYKITLNDGVEWAQGKGVTLSFDLVAPKESEISDSTLISNKPVKTTAVSRAVQETRGAYNSFGIAANKLQVVETGAIGTQLIRASADVTASYVDVKGDTIADDVVQSGYFDDDYTTTQKQIPGYDFVKVEGKTSGKFGADAVKVTYIYKKTSAPVTVKYVDEAGKTIAASKELTGDFGDVYTSTAADVSGWTLKETPKNASGTFTADAQTVTYVYERADAAPVTVNYVDEKGNKLADPDKLMGKVSNPYNTTAKNIAGWTLKETPNNATGTFTVDAQTVTYVYERADAADVTVNYVNEKGDKLVASDILSGKIDAAYNTTAKTISGWTLKETPKNAIGTFTDTKQTVTYVYEKADAVPVTVRYVDEKGNDLTNTDVLPGKVGDAYTTSSKVLSGWALKETPSNAQGTFTDKAQTVTYVYERANAADVTVKYVDTDGKELATPDVLSGKIANPYNTTAKNISGWALKETPSNAQGMFTDAKQTVTYVYEKANAADVTVDYVDGKGNKLVASDILSGKVSNPYSTTAKNIAGWTLKETPNNAQGTFTDKAQTVTYVYEKADAVSVTVRYVDEKGNDLIKADVISGKVGDAYTTDSKVLSGWTLKTTPNNAQGTFTDKAQTVTYVYERADAANVTVDYVDGKGNKLAASDVLSGKVANPYNTTAKNISGWALKETPNNAQGTFTDKAQTVTYVYERADAADVTVNYVDEKGNKLVASDILSGKIDNPYSTMPKNIAGWTLKETPKNATGTFTDTKQTVTYVYEKADAVPVTVKYVDGEGHDLAKADVLSGKVGDAYTTDPKVFAGWTLKETPTNAKGLFTDTAQTVTYVYEKTDAANVTVNYVDKDGNALAMPDSLSGKIGDEYTSSPKELAGWTLKETPKNAKGTFTDKAQTVTYVYEKTDAAAVTVKYVDEKGNELATPDNLSGKLGDAYETTAKSIVGWTLKTTPDNAKGKFTDKAQTVTYVYVRAEAKDVTVKYVDKDGNELSASITLSGKVGDSYTSKAKQLSGWKLKETPNNAEGIFTDATQTVTYVYLKDEEAVVVTPPTTDDQSKGTTTTLTDTPNGGSHATSANKTKTETGSLPQTDEATSLLMTLVGAALLATSLIFMVGRKKAKRTKK
ncbi:MucBP domain-containing protein [Dellaglioa carnosa]|uniref:MucBP domain-containing protein n=1 Tax=Dellaglioa carnosa TaxID=2995136 RepID=A0ABT4JNL0_9LACO|nr:MucBP domain-containing protein [Dellaglioa carnosa]MCZ2491956.1 MucBP domain-containing protein [Dellaglioa carnosa]MCZ2495011.1 MucBP domain-containing protein [Dellaglioa carnosa]MDK1731877.1 MucBP domain-containing protein [Dellaglioa carnosa]